jgi:hypothetical protein
LTGRDSHPLDGEHDFRSSAHSFLRAALPGRIPIQFLYVGPHPQ